MKINGRVNIMGIKEVIFHYGDGFMEETKYVCDESSTWCRIPNRHTRSEGFYRTHEQMTRSIKALALNPHAELSFNDGLMVITLE